MSRLLGRHSLYGATLCALILVTPQTTATERVTADVEHMKRAAAAGSCLTGCSSASWNEFNAIDGRMDTAWSSVYYSSSGNYEWFAHWFNNGRGDGLSKTSYIRIRPRIVSGQSGHVPSSINIYWAQPGVGWTYLQTESLPSSISAAGYKIGLSSDVVTDGILLTTSNLRDAPWDSGAYYFQLAEIDAGYDDCSEWDGDDDMETWCAGNPAYFDNVLADTYYRSNEKVKYGVNASYGGAVFEVFGKNMGAGLPSDFMHKPWNANVIHPNGGSGMQLDIYGVKNNHGLTLCPGIPSSPWGHVYNSIMAIGTGCDWNTSTNDITGLSLPSDRVHTEIEDPGQFSATTAWTDLKLQWAPILQDSYIEIPSLVEYSGATTFGNHPQNVPVVFTGTGMNYKFYYYSGSNSTCGADSNITSVGPYNTWGSSEPSRFLLIDGNSYIHTPTTEVVGTAKESWVTACDQSENRCITLATKKSTSVVQEFQITRGDVGSDPARHGAMAFVSQFTIAPASPKFEQHVGGVYVFPYRFSDPVGPSGATVRSVICSLQ